MGRFSDLMRHNVVVHEAIREDLYRSLERTVHQAIRGSVSNEDQMNPIWEGTALKTALMEIFLHEIKLPHSILKASLRKSREQRFSKLWQFLLEATSNTYVDVIKTITLIPQSDQENCLSWARKALQQPECLKGVFNNTQVIEQYYSEDACLRTTEFTGIVIQLLQAVLPELQQEAVAPVPEIPTKLESTWEQPINMKHRHHRKGHKHHHSHKGSGRSRRGSMTSSQDEYDVFSSEISDTSEILRDGTAQPEVKTEQSSSPLNSTVPDAQNDASRSPSSSVTKEELSNTETEGSTIVEGETITDNQAVNSVEEMSEPHDEIPDRSAASDVAENNQLQKLSKVQTAEEKLETLHLEEASLMVAAAAAAATTDEVHTDPLSLGDHEAESARQPEEQSEPGTPTALAEPCSTTLATPDLITDSGTSGERSALSASHHSIEETTSVADTSNVSAISHQSSEDFSRVADTSNVSAISQQSSEDFSRVFQKNFNKDNLVPLDEAPKGHIPEGFVEEEEEQFEEGLNEFTEVLLENEVWSLFKREWKPSSHPPHWTNEEGEAVPAGLDIAPPVRWEWKEDWEVSAKSDKEHDAEGWRYAEFGLFGAKFHSSATRMCQSRSRRWTRTRIETGKIQLESVVQKDEKKQNGLNWGEWAGRSGSGRYEPFDITRGVARKISKAFGSLIGTSDSGDEDDFVMIDEQDEQEVLMLLGKIADIQEAENPIPPFCAGCNNPLPVLDFDTHKFVKLCFYDGKWYCTSCHTGKEAPIPAYILTKNDFSPHPVCNRNALFLEKTQYEPVFNQLLISDHEGNSALIEKSENLTAVRESIQSMFNVIERNNCDKFDATSARMAVFPRDHLVMATTSYSLQDLMEFDDSVERKDGTAREKLMDLLHQLQDHIEGCPTCSGDHDEPNTKM